MRESHSHHIDSERPNAHASTVLGLQAIDLWGRHTRIQSHNREPKPRMGRI